jgi:RNA recognition motif-containing protein
VKKVLEKGDIAKQKDDEISRKIFLGGLNKTTTEANLEKYFSNFGEIEDILVNRNIEDGSSKGCAFLLFKERSVAQNLLARNQLHLIDGYQVEAKQCYEKSKSKAIKQDKEFEKVFGSFQMMPQNDTSFAGSIMQQQNYM